MPNSMCFPPHIALPFDYLPPTVDGYAEWEVGLPLAPQDTVETGWTESARETYGGASGIPSMSFQAIKHNSEDYLYLSWVVRLDLSYDDIDAVLLVLQPTFNAAAHSADTRRILINPNIPGVGAGVNGAGDPGAVDFTESVTVNGQVETMPVRSNHPSNVTFATYNTTTTKWDELPTGTITNYDLKCRSWTLSTNDQNWSIELKIPTTKALGGTSWIDFNLANFGLYFNALRFGSGTGSLQNVGPLVTEFSWPTGDVLTGAYLSLKDIPVPATKMGQAASGTGCQGVGFWKPWGSIGVLSGTTVTSVVDDVADNVFVAELVNDATTDAAGVEATFRLANFGIAGGPGAWATIPVTTGSNPTPRATIPMGGATTPLEMHWQLSAADRATYLGHGGDQCLWVVLDSDQQVMFKESSHRENLSFKNLSEVKQDVVISGKDLGPTADGGPDHDVLLVVSHRVLASTVNYDGWTARPPGSTAGGLNLKDIPRPNLDQVKAEGEGNGDGYGDHTGQTVPWVAQQIFTNWQGNSAVNYTWVAITSAYRRTADGLTLAGTAYPIYSMIDSFSHILTHQGEPDTFVHTMDGDGLQQVGDGVYRLLVPDGGETVLTVAYSTDVPPPPSPADKLDQVEDTVETEAQRLAAQAKAAHDALGKIFDPDEKKD